MKRLVLPEVLAGLRQSEQAGHLAGGGADVRAAVVLGGEVLPFTVLIQAARGEVAVHLPAGAGGFLVQVGVGVELGEPLLHGELADGEHEGHVAVVAAAPVAMAELLGQGHLGQLLAITEDAELGLAGQHLLAAQQAGLPAHVHQFIIAQDLRAHLLQGHALLGGGSVFRGRHRHGRGRSPKVRQEAGPFGKRLTPPSKAPRTGARAGARPRCRPIRPRRGSPPPGRSR